MWDCVLVLLSHRVQYSTRQESEHTMQHTILGQQAQKGARREQEPQVCLHHGLVWSSIPRTGMLEQNLVLDVMLDMRLTSRKMYKYFKPISNDESQFTYNPQLTPSVY